MAEVVLRLRMLRPTLGASSTGWGAGVGMWTCLGVGLAKEGSGMTSASLWGGLYLGLASSWRWSCHLLTNWLALGLSSLSKLSFLFQLSFF